MAFASREWICPYFSRVYKDSVHCEFGQRLKFPDHKLAESFFEAYCCSHEYKQCSIANMLEEYYEQQENKNGASI